MNIAQFQNQNGALTNAKLLGLPDRRYEGRIASVAEEVIRNQFLGKNETVVVLRFDDGAFWIPSQKALNVLIPALGFESDDWIGRRIAVVLVARAKGRQLEKVPVVLAAA